MVKVGDTIRIDYMDNEPQYTGKVGVVEKITKDCYGEMRLEGTWGGCAIYPSIDSYTILNEGH